MKRHSRFFTDGEGRVRYMGNDRKAKDASGAQVSKTGTAPQRGEKGQFITKEGRVIFIGGPGGGGGSAGGGAGAGTITRRPGYYEDTQHVLSYEPSNREGWYDVQGMRKIAEGESITEPFGYTVTVPSKAQADSILQKLIGSGTPLNYLRAIYNSPEQIQIREENTRAGIERFGEGY